MSAGADIVATGDTRSRVVLNSEAEDLLRNLWTRCRPLMFHQSAGCCDRAEQLEYWSPRNLTLDVAKGRGGGFSMEPPEGVRLTTRSELMETAVPFA